MDWGTFIDRLRQYAGGDGKNPSLATNSTALDGLERTVSIFFERPVLDLIVSRPDNFKKEFTCATTYGYVGASQGGTNGICLLKSSDVNMKEKLETFAASRKGAALLEKYAISTPQHVKLVVHKPNGLRVIGFYEHNEEGGVVLFTHQEQYRK